MNPRTRNKLPKLKRWQLYLFFLLAILTISSCEIQEDMTKAQIHKEHLVEEKSFHDLLLLNGFNAAYQKIVQKKEESVAARTALEDEYNFIIVEDKPVKIIQTDNKTYYNILIRRDSIHAEYFENLVVMLEKINNEDELSAYILNIHLRKSTNWMY
ncbi:MAG TPA: hypothetical protein VK623_07710 [Flavobacterium sp.]|nr:hypothetical protein [Flavobacterium sp.]